MNLDNFYQWAEQQAGGPIGPQEVPEYGEIFSAPEPPTEAPGLPDWSDWEEDADDVSDWDFWDDWEPNADDWELMFDLFDDLGLNVY